jgi:hypothetical protein
MDEKIEQPASATDEPAEATEDDVSGHNFGYEAARQQAREKVRETEIWAKREALRREAKKSPLDRLRGR